MALIYAWKLIIIFLRISQTVLSDKIINRVFNDNIKEESYVTNEYDAETFPSTAPSKSDKEMEIFAIEMRSSK